MDIIIVGDGKVGYSLAEHLLKVGNSVTIIDKNPEALRKASETLDVICIRGSGASTGILLEAGVKTADLLIAATTSDEMNMVCCLTAKKLGAKHTIARIRDPEYANELTTLKEELELDMVINPKEAAAREAALLLRFPSASDVETFSKGKINLITVTVTQELPIVGLKLKEISHKISGKCTQKIKSVMIVGGGRIAYYLTRILSELDIKAKIIEIDKERCPTGNYAQLSILSKGVLSLCMFTGRLEIFPILLLFAPSFWKRVNI